VRSRGFILAPGSGHVSNFCCLKHGPLEPPEVLSGQQPPHKTGTPIQTGHPGWTLFERYGLRMKLPDTRSTADRPLMYARAHFLKLRRRFDSRTSCPIVRLSLRHDTEARFRLSGPGGPSPGNANLAQNSSAPGESTAGQVSRGIGFRSIGGRRCERRRAVYASKELRQAHGDHLGSRLGILVYTTEDFGSEETQFAAQRWVDLLRHMIPPGLAQSARKV